MLLRGVPMMSRWRNTYRMWAILDEARLASPCSAMQFETQIGEFETQDFTVARQFGRPDAVMRRSQTVRIFRA
jgi:hypothetical protein